MSDDHVADMADASEAVTAAELTFPQVRGPQTRFEVALNARTILANYRLLRLELCSVYVLLHRSLTYMIIFFYFNIAKDLFTHPRVHVI